MKGTQRILLTIAVLALGSASATAATTLFYSESANPGWAGPTAWNMTSVGDAGDQAWADNSTAVFGPASDLIVVNNANRTLTGLTNNGAGTVTLQDASGVVKVLSIGGGQVNTNAGNITIGVRQRFDGDFTKIGAGTLNFASSSTSGGAYTGTATVSAGRLTASNANAVGASSHFIVNDGGTLFPTGTAAMMIGNVTLNAGTVGGILSLGGPLNNALTLTMGNLSGTGGLIEPGTGVSTFSRLRTLNIGQTTNATFAGAFDGRSDNNKTPTPDGTHTLKLVKQGAANLTLTGTVGGTAAGNTGVNGLVQRTEIREGGLYINTSSTNFGNGSQNALLVGDATNLTYGTLGGTGTVKATGGSDVVVNEFGKLAPGALDSVGKLTFDLQGTNAFLDLSLIDMGGLLFDLGDDTLAGTTYDQIALTAGRVKIDALSFEDFTFNTLTGFGAGTYVLFTTTSGFDGTLGTSLSGTIGGLTGTIAFANSNNDLVLTTIVPEPTIGFLLAGGLTAAVMLRRRRR